MIWRQIDPGKLKLPKSSINVLAYNNSFCGCIINIISPLRLVIYVKLTCVDGPKHHSFDERWEPLISDFTKWKSLLNLQKPEIAQAIYHHIYCWCGASRRILLSGWLQIQNPESKDPWVDVVRYRSNAKVSDWCLIDIAQRLSVV